MRILLDETVPRQLARSLVGHEVRTVPGMGWASIGNGELLRRADPVGFDALLTVDRNMECQQDIAGAGVGILVLVDPWNAVRDLHAACAGFSSGACGPTARAGGAGRGVNRPPMARRGVPCRVASPDGGIIPV